MKGIILAGGLGTRLYPSTQQLSKQLLPVYDKPMIYYPLSTLMLAGLREILLISTPRDLPIYQYLLGDGSQWGISLSYLAQPQPGGIAQALLLAEDFIADQPSCLILGDNILYGDGLSPLLQQAAATTTGATIFGYAVRDPERYGVISFDAHDNPIHLEEKPQCPQSHYAIIGLYFYDATAVARAKQLKPSARGELEITDLNRLYLADQQLHAIKLRRGHAWLDTGTHDSLLDAANFIKTLELRQGFKIGSPEEVAWRMGFIDGKQLETLAIPLMPSGYGQYLLELLA